MRKIAFALGFGTVVVASLSCSPLWETMPANQEFATEGNFGVLNDDLQPQMVLQAMTIVADWQLSNPSQYKPYGWQEAAFWAGMSAFAPISHNPKKYFDAIRRNGERNEWKPGPRLFNADDLAITQSYFLLYKIEHDRNMITPALSRFDEMLQVPFNESLEFTREKTRREWVWCDALFMLPPALALATSVTGDLRYADLMDRLWWKTTDYLYDKEEHLYYRDSRFFTYALAWGVNEGILDRNNYEATVRKGWSALIHAVHPNGMLGYVQPVGYRPDNTGWDHTEVYGVGAFLLTGSEVYRLTLTSNTPNRIGGR